jgi:putative membrane protein
MIKKIRDFINGLAFGITQIVPGVSGGTIAIILGFYYELIEAVNHFTEDYRKYLRFILPFLLGTVIGIVTFSSIINYLLTNYSFPTMLFFIGLIVGIIPPIYFKVKDPARRFTFGEIALVALPALALLIISELKAVSVTNPVEIINNIDIPYMFFIFFAGVIAAMALIMPGVSGSFVLLLLGIYPLITYSLSTIGNLLTDITNITLMLDICKVLVPLGIGVIIGGLSMARLIEKLLKDYYKITYLVILGLLIGSVYALFNEPIVFQSGVSAITIIISSVTFLLGFIISFYLGKKRL